jgi:CRISPR/Cas system CSM-associated protein Csm5 (group 7 of RAMP superfamily)
MMTGYNKHEMKRKIQGVLLGWGGGWFFEVHFFVILQVKIFSYKTKEECA